MRNVTWYQHFRNTDWLNDLSFSCRYLFRRGRIRGRKPFLVIITDGKSQDGVAAPAASLKRKGVDIFALGYGTKFRRLDLQQMASSPSYVMTASFGKISAILAAVKKKACQPFVPRKLLFLFLPNLSGYATICVT